MVFFSYSSGFTKEETGFYEDVMNVLNLKADEIMFWDDEKENVQAAKKAGIDAYFYNNYEEFLQIIESKFGINS